MKLELRLQQHHNCRILKGLPRGSAISRDFDVAVGYPMVKGLRQHLGLMDHDLPIIWRETRRTERSIYYEATHTALGPKPVTIRQAL